jgi:hypothetical protein
LAVYSGNSKIILFNSIEIQSATVLVPAAPIARPVASTAQATRFVMTNAKTRKSTTKNTRLALMLPFLSLYVSKKSLKFLYFSGFLFEILPARNRLPQFLLRKLHSAAVVVSLHQTAGKTNLLNFDA